MREHVYCVDALYVWRVLRARAAFAVLRVELKLKKDTSIGSNETKIRPSPTGESKLC